MFSPENQERDSGTMVWNLIKWIGLAGIFIGALIALVAWFDLDRKRF
jgi:hypothetical protein